MHGVIDVHRVVVVRRHRSDDSRQHRHRMRVITKAAEESQHAFVEHRMCANRLCESLQLGHLRQITVKQQVGNFDEARVGGELLDRVTPIHQDSLLAIDERDVRSATACRNETRIVGEDALFLVQAPDVDDVGSRGPAQHRQFRFNAAGADQAVGILALRHPHSLATSGRTSLSPGRRNRRSFGVPCNAGTGRTGRRRKLNSRSISKPRGP